MDTLVVDSIFSSLDNHPQTLQITTLLLHMHLIIYTLRRKDFESLPNLQICSPYQPILRFETVVEHTRPKKPQISTEVESTTPVNPATSYYERMLQKSCIGRGSRSSVSNGKFSDKMTISRALDPLLDIFLWLLTQLI